MAATMAAVFCIARAGFPTPYYSIAKVLGLAFLILNSPALGRQAWFAHPGVMPMWVIFLLGLAGWFMPSASTVGACAALGGYVLFGLNSVRCLRASKRHPVLAAMAATAGVLVGGYAAGKYWGLGYGSALYRERLLVNAGHIDALWHATLTNMIRNYGKPSTGLDGLPYLAYHYGSHWLDASLAPLCGMETYDFICAGFGILFVPTMFAGLLMLAGVIRRMGQSPPQDGGDSQGLLFWFIAVAGFLGPLPKKGDMMRTSLQEVFVSDSYVLSLSISFAMAILALAYYQERRRSRDFGCGVDKLSWLILLPALIAVCGLIKISTGYLLLGMTFFCVWRLGLWKKLFVSAGFVISGISFLAVYGIGTAENAVQTKLKLLNFDRIHPEWIPFFFIFYYFWVWAFILMRLRQMRLETFDDVRVAALDKSTFPMEILLFCSLIGVVPYLIFDFGYGNWNYFTQYQTFLGLGLLLAYVPSWPSGSKDIMPQGFSGIRTTTFMAAIFAFFLLLHLGTTVFSSFYNLLKENMMIRAQLAGYPSEEWRSRLRSLYTAERGKMSARAQRRSETLELLERLGRLPSEQKRQSLLYIPKANRAYWGELRQAPPRKAVTPFIATALTGMAMVDGLPEYEDLLTDAVPGWGYSGYALPMSAQAPTSVELMNIESRVSGAGFATLWVFEPDSGGVLQTRRLGLSVGKKGGTGP